MLEAEGHTDFLQQAALLRAYSLSSARFWSTALTFPHTKPIYLRHTPALRWHVHNVVHGAHGAFFFLRTETTEVFLLRSSLHDRVFQMAFFRMEPAGTRLFRRPGSVVPFPARGAGGPRRRQRLRKLTPVGLKRITHRGPTQHRMEPEARVKGSTGRLPSDRQPPAGRRGSPVPLGHRSSLSAVHDSSKFILFQYFCLHTMQVTFLQGSQPHRGPALPPGRPVGWL